VNFESDGERQMNARRTAMKAKKWLWAVTLAGVLASGTEQALAVFGTSEPVAIDSVGSLEVDGHVEVGVWPFVATDEEAGVLLDGEVLFSSVGEARYDWQPQAPGTHVMECRVDGVVVASETVVVKSLAFEVAQEPNPPTEADPNLSITPTARNFGTGGGAYAIVTSGSGTWEASASVGWIALNAASGQAGYPVAYSVSATTNVEARTGYVYVSGHVHTVTQDGVGATISPGSTAFGMAGGTGTVAVSSGTGIAWQARANCDWVTVTPTSGKGVGTVTFTVPPMHDVKARQGTLTVAGQTFTVVQTGRRMAIEPMFATCDYLTHAISLAVEALPDTAWSVSSDAGWISVEDADSGRGRGAVQLSIDENPSWLSRAGKVTIGTETILVTQKGRTVLEFGVSPESTRASVDGANGRFEVAATPDLPWSAKSLASWLTIPSDARTGEGNGTVVYSAAPNPTLFERTGKIVVMPGDSKVSAKMHTVTQPAASASLTAVECELAARGESCEVWVSVADIVEWQIENTNGWLKVEGQPNRKGPGMVTLQAATNTTVYPRSGTVTIARLPFTVTQKARSVEVGYGTKVFGADGGSDVLPIKADEAVAWTAVASDPTWITIWQGGNGAGNGEVMYIVSPYVGDGDGRTGSIAVGDQVVRIIQREQLFPSAQDAAGVAVVLADAADKRLGERIATVEEYDSLRAWIAGKGLDEAAVMESAHVWPSYALGAETLFENEPDVQIAGFTPETGAIQRSAEGFTWEVRVTVKDGENEVSVDADKVAALFEASRQIGDWTEGSLLPLSVTATGTDGGTLLFEATLAGDAEPGAFLRLGE
jgi:hypothetical protein